MKDLIYWSIGKVLDKMSKKWKEEAATILGEARKEDEFKLITEFDNFLKKAYYHSSVIDNNFFKEL